ncbi:MAG TPA: Uma2 family endonuclease [Pirellulales bacterium]|nr:Uma2 family endonuclease [Pirellulales bacterium]
MAQVENPPNAMTLTDLAELFGPMPAWRIRSVPVPGTATEQDVIDIEEHENRLCELVEGVLVEKTVGFYESVIAVAIARRLGDFVETHNLGVVSGEGGMMRLFPGMVRIPDVAFASWKEFPDGITEEPVPNIVPDLAVEVLSEGNTKPEMDRKLDDYFGAGVRLVWFVEPRKKTVEVFTGKDESTVLDENATLSGGDVLPGFSMPLRPLFAKPKKK